MTLSILICHLPKRKNFLDALLRSLDDQIAGDYDEDGTDQYLWKQNYQDVEILIHASPYDSVGEKRNRLLNSAIGDYVCFIDDDDRVIEKYISLLFAGIHKGVDCCSLKGIITEDGLNPKTFIHSIRYTSWYEKDGIYYRYPNHLSCIKSSIAKQFRFPEINTGEDHNWSTQIFDSKLIKSEHWIEEPIYFYDYRSKK